MTAGQYMAPLTVCAADTGCTHVYTAACYEDVVHCTHRHGAECYPADARYLQTATPSNSDNTEPTECTHICDEASGHITKRLNCRHERNEDCGYQAADQQGRNSTDEESADTKITDKGHVGEGFNTPRIHMGL